MGLHQKKENVRKRLLAKRQNISQEKWEKYSKKVVERLKQLSAFQEAKTVHCYVSMNKRREVNTHYLIKEMLINGKKVVVPTANFKKGTLSHFKLKSFEALATNKWGILEPEKGKRVAISELNLVIVPMAGGDETCHRIGYGGGFYDRFLKDISVPKMGLTFEQNIVKKLPVEPFDIPLDRIITEKRVIASCKAGE